MIQNLEKAIQDVIDEHGPNLSCEEFRKILNEKHFTTNTVDNQGNYMLLGGENDATDRW